MTLPEQGNGNDRRLADALDRYWDSLSSTHPGGRSRPEEMLEPGLKHVVRQVQFVDEAPRVDPAFAGQLWADLMRQSQSPPLAMPVSGAVAAPAPGGLARRLTTLPRHRFLMELTVAAALLLAVLGGGSALRLPGGLDPVAPTAAAEAVAPGVASVAASAGCRQTVTPEPTRTAGADQDRAMPTSLPVPTAPATLAERC